MKMNKYQKESVDSASRGELQCQASVCRRLPVFLCIEFNVHNSWGKGHQEKYVK